MKVQDMEALCICCIVLKDKKKLDRELVKDVFLYYIFLFMLSRINFCFRTHTYTQQKPTFSPPQTNQKNPITTIRIPVVGFERAGFSYYFVRMK